MMEPHLNGGVIAARFRPDDYRGEAPAPEEPAEFAREFAEHIVYQGAKGASPTPKRKMVFEWFDDAASLALSEPATPLIEDLLDESAMSVFYGESNAGKSFVALDMSYAVATGGEWNGKRAKRGLVVYVCAEGGRRFARRIAALKETRGHTGEKALFALINYPIDLRSNDADAKQLLELVKDAETQCSERCAWLIVDTLSRALAGGDENSPVDMGRIVAAADRIRAETGAHFTYVHHSGKDVARGARGHSLLRAATDTEIEIAVGAIKITKQRDMECGGTFGFRLSDVPLGTDSAGRPIKSAVVEWRDAPDAKQPAAKTVPVSLRLLFDTIEAAIIDAGDTFRPFPDGPPVSAVFDGIVRERYFARIAEQAASEPDKAKLAERQKRGFNRAVAMALASKRLVATEREGRRFLWFPDR